jgi:hypothetical protein
VDGWLAGRSQECVSPPLLLFLGFVGSHVCCRLCNECYVRNRNIELNMESVESVVQ